MNKTNIPNMVNLEIDNKTLDIVLSIMQVQLSPEHENRVYLEKLHYKYSDWEDNRFPVADNH